MTKKKLHSTLLIAGLVLSGVVDALTKSPWAHATFGVWILGVLTQWRHIVGEVDDVVESDEVKEAKAAEARSMRIEETPTPPERPKAA